MFLVLPGHYIYTKDDFLSSLKKRGTTSNDLQRARHDLGRSETI